MRLHSRTAIAVAALWVGVAWGDNATSTCPNTTVNGAANTCYTVTPPALGSGVVIAVDGNEGGQWAAAQSKNLTGGLTGIVQFFRDTGNLYVLVTVNDTTNNPSDRIELHFDPLHNHAATTDNMSFSVVRNIASPNLQKTTSSGTNPWTPATLGSAAAITSAAGSWVAEFKFSAAELGVSDLPVITGFGVQAQDLPNDDFTAWPADFNSLNPTSTWANVKSRFPIEYMVVLDQSGSMLSQNKWNNAKSAANYLTNAMSILRDATYFNDQIGLVTFSWDNSGNVDQTTTPKALGPVPVFPAGNWTDSPPAASPPQSQFYTPIGKGLDAAFNATGTGTEETQRVVLFMSDGLHNRPASQVPLLPSHLLYDPCPGTLNWNACVGVVPNVQVNTVAFGTDTGVDSLLLSNIKTRFSGAFASTYNIVTDVEPLKEAFISSLDELYRMNLLPTLTPAVDGTEFTLNPGERRLVVIGSWTTSASAATFNLQQKANPGDPWPAWPTGQVTCLPSAVDTSVGFATCAVTNPAGGRWRAVDNAGNPITSDRIFVLVDLTLRARFGIDQEIHGTGRDITLTADLKEAGRPAIRDASHPMQVRVRVRRASESLGTYLSTHTLQNCQPQPPTLPPIVQGPSISGPGLLARTSPVAAAATHSIDVQPYRYALIDALFQRCGKKDVSTVEDPGLEMFDDGTNGDVTANDGIYTLRFVNTQYEGSYIFTYNVSGTAPSASLFTRGKTMAEYIRVEVDPGSTQFDDRLVQQTGTIAIREYYVLPRDRLGNYLGPGYADQVQFAASSGTWLGAVIDYGNGFYARRLRYDTTQTPPVVVPTVQDKPITPPGPDAGRPVVISFHLGTAMPHGALANDFNNGFSAGLDLEYRFTPKFSAEAYIGHDRFSPKANSGPDFSITHISGHGKVTLPSGATRISLHGGLGAYILRGGTTRFGWNLGTSIQRWMTSRFAIEATYNYRQVHMSGPALRYSTVHGGTRLAF